MGGIIAAEIFAGTMFAGGIVESVVAFAINMVISSVISAVFAPEIGRAHV